MFNNRNDLDRHVKEVFNKLGTDSERDSKCYMLAKLYHKIKEYETAIKYVDRYITNVKNTAQCQRLLGECYEALNKTSLAFDAYRASLELDGNQRDLVVRVCDLLTNPELPLVSSQASYWLERLQGLYPSHPTVFKLKERIMQTDPSARKDPKELENLILSEILARPSDATVRIRFLNLLLETKRLKVAQEQAAELLASGMFHDNLQGFECIQRVFKMYEAELGPDVSQEYLFRKLAVLERRSYLTLQDCSQEKRSISECVTAVFSFDQGLYAVSTAKIKPSDKRNISAALTHFRGQLAYHFAILKLKRAKTEPGEWTQAVRHANPFLMFASKPSNIDRLNDYREAAGWQSHEAERVAVATHVLRAQIEEKNRNLLQEIHETCGGKWRERVFEKMFMVKDQKDAMLTSCFLTDPSFLDLPATLPSDSELQQFDLEAQTSHPESLHHATWLGLSNVETSGQIKPVFRSCVVPDLRLSATTASSTGLESLTRLDVDAFLYASVFCSKAQARSYVSSDRPGLLPVSITEQLCSLQQSEWWSIVYKSYRNKSVSNYELRLRLRKGTETIRAQGNHGLHPQLLVLLARQFKLRAEVTDDVVLKEALEQRSLSYWTVAMPLLERMERNKVLRDVSSKLFDFQSDWKQEQVQTAIEEGKLCLAVEIMNNGRYEDALDALQALKSAHASYYQALIYMKVAEELPKDKENMGPDSEYRILLSRARDCSRITGDRLRRQNNTPANQRLHELLLQLSDQLERLLVRADLDNKEVTRTPLANRTAEFSDIFSNFGAPRTPRSLGSLSTQSTPRPVRFEPATTDTSDVDKLAKQFNKMVTMEVFTDELTRINSSLDDMKSILYDLLGEFKKLSTKMTDRPAISDVFRPDEFFEFGEADEYAAPTVPETNANSYNNLSQHARTAVPAPAAPLNYVPPFTPAQQMAQYYQGLVWGGGLPFSDGQQLPDFRALPGTATGLPNLSNVLPIGSHAVDMNNPNLVPNVVVTSSSVVPPIDSRPVQQPSMSVIIPPQHFRGSKNTVPKKSDTPGAHAFQIAMPPGNGIGSAPAPVSVTSTIATASVQVQSPSDKFNDQIPKPKVTQTIASPIAPATLNLSTKPQVAAPIPEPKKVVTPPKKPAAPEVAAPKITTTPKITEKKEEPKITFGITSTPAAAPTQKPPLLATPVFTAKPESKKDSLASDVPVFGQKAQGGFDFLAKAGSTADAFKKTADFSFANTGMPIFGKSPAVQPGSPNTSAEEKGEDYEPTAEFAPVIPLPDLVDIVTGEEEEKIIYEHRAKILRFATETKEWKEKGVGNVKLLQHPESGKIRILMRRDQVHKVCCNHYINENMKFEQMKSSDKAATWTAQDYSDGESKPELLAIRFGKRETLLEFLNIVEGLQKRMQNGRLEGTKVAEPPKQPTNAKPLSEMFKQPAGTWECDTCMVRNKPEVNKCLSCDTPRPGAVTSETPKKPAENPALAAGFSFGIPAKENDQQKPLSELFKKPAGSWECSVCLVQNKPDANNCLSCETLRPGAQPDNKPTKSEFSFGVSSTTPAFSFGVKPEPNAAFKFGTPATTTTTATGFTFGSATAPAFSFGVKQETTPATINGDNKENDFKLGSANKFSFTFNKPVASAEASSPIKCEDSSYEENDLEKEDETLQFKPVIPLPDKVDVVTGEENEEVLFSQRAKLYRFVDNEWKERGLGDLKILKHKQTGKVRLLMRREQVLKVCLNHYLLKETEFLPMPKEERAWIWQASDFSEGTVAQERFCVRFRDKDLAKSFKEAVAKEQLTLSPSPVRPSKPDAEEDVNKNSSVARNLFKDDDPVALYQYVGTPEEVAEARRLQLPDNWFKYNQAEPCAGCVGCDNDTESEKSGPVSKESPKKPEVSKPNEPKKSESKPDEPKKPEVSKPDESKQKVESSTDVTSTTTSGKSGIVKPSVLQFGQIPKPTETIFNKENEKTVEPPPPSKEEPPATPKSSVFANFSFKNIAPETPKSLFGSLGNTTTTPIFGSAAGNIFGNKPEPNKPVPENQPVFGQHVFGSSKPVFGTTPDTTKPIFGNYANTKPTTGLFSEMAKSLEGTEPAFKDTTGFSFASIAKEGAKNGAPSWGTGEVKPVFGGKAFSPRKPGGNDDDDDDPEAENEHDPQFAPIVELPPVVEVKTGEEDEVKLFCERAKLYRFDNDLKEWKERGVGEMKVLHNVQENSYRLLLRREQVHKVVCNMRITPDMELKVMPKTTNAWLWGGMNYIEGTNSREQLAVRFKLESSFNQFKTVVDECIIVLREASIRNQEQSNRSDELVENVSYTGSAEDGDYEEEEYCDYDEEEEDDDEYDDDDDDDEESVPYLDEGQPLRQ